MARNLLDLNIKDPMSGYILARKEVFENMDWPDGYKFGLTLLVKAKKENLEISEIPIVFFGRKAGKSKAGLSEAIRTLRLIFKLRFQS